MESRVIHQEQLASCDAWQLVTLCDERRESRKPSSGTVAQKLNILKAAKQREGYDIGYGQGRAEALKSVAEQVARLQSIVSSVEGAGSLLEQQHAGDVLDLAIEIARQILRGELSARRDALLPVVREAMSALPDSSLRRRLILHPSDLDIVRAHLGEELKLGSWQVVEDHLIEPGGCRVLSAAGEVDATLGTRWQRVLLTLNRTQAWHND